FNVESVDYKSVRFNIWDIGGQPKLRPLWKHYYLNTQAVVFVIDSSDKERLPEALSELSKLMSEKELKDAALLILANKQDIAGAESIESITQQLALYKLCCGHSWNIQASDALSGDGLHDGLEWLSRQLLALIRDGQRWNEFVWPEKGIERQLAERPRAFDGECAVATAESTLLRHKSTSSSNDAAFTRLTISV
ncbi:hypothetical protein LSTR_LSTR014921, partial [Laodelphax striatellus]